MSVFIPTNIEFLLAEYWEFAPSSLSRREKILGWGRGRRRIREKRRRRKGRKEKRKKTERKRELLAKLSLSI